MWSKALEIASHLTLPIPVVAFALVFAVLAFSLALRTKKRNVSMTFLAVLVAVVILGLAPLLTSTFLQARGIYRISVNVLDPDKHLIREVQLSSLPAAQIKKADGAWEVEIAPQIRPGDGVVSLIATVPDAYLEGSTKVLLGKDYFPTVTIQLEPLPSVIVRGVVLDENGHPVSGAKVAIEGYSEIGSTNEMGNFQIASHQARGQQLTLMAQKDGMSAKKTGPAGDGFELVLRKP